MTVTPLGRDQDCSIKNQELDVWALLVPGSREDEVQSNCGGLAPTSRIQEPRDIDISCSVLQCFYNG
ncbi:hypothetical protein STEG23_005034, partial [Scotinomys teguina]